MNKSLLKYYFEWCCILTYSSLLSIYAFSKTTQFENRLKIATPVNELTGFRLMWAFYGYSTTYPIIIGIFQLLSIGLIIPKKTRLIGCILGTIILSNIILQDIIYGVPSGALFNAIFLQLLIVIIVYFNRTQLCVLIKNLLKTTDSINLKGFILKQKIISLFTALGCFILFVLILQCVWLGITVLIENFEYFIYLI